MRQCYKGLGSVAMDWRVKRGGLAGDCSKFVAETAGANCAMKCFETLFYLGGIEWQARVIVG